MSMNFCVEQPLQEPGGLARWGEDRIFDPRPCPELGHSVIASTVTIQETQAPIVSVEEVEFDQAS